MATIGTIKEIKPVDGQLQAVIETGSGPAVTATIMQAGAVDFFPIPGDRVLYHYAGKEVVVSAIFSEDNSAAPGEWLVFSRNPAGEVQAVLHLKADGTVNAGTGADFVALAAKVDALWATLDKLFRTDWTPVANDGGAALQMAWLTVAFPTPPSSVASTNLKAD